MSPEGTHKIVEVTASGRSGYQIVSGARTRLPALMRAAGVDGSACLIVTDDNVAELYGSAIENDLEEAGFDVSTFVVRPGEASKDLEVVANLYRWAFANQVDRATPVVALGGGVVGDLGGFFAATVLRGVPLVHVPTTLVAQVDSSIGGKTGVNHVSGKNLIGSFYRPTLILTDTELLSTLPDREWRNGLSEVLKHALIRDLAFFDWLRTNWDSVLRREEHIVPEMVERAAQIKVDVVIHDELEGGLRRILNFGHTFGHAMERIAGYGSLGHGEAVALGMRAAAFLSAERGADVDIDALGHLLQDIVPTSIPPMPIDWLLQSMRRDKKRVGEVLHVVLLEEIGSAVVASDVTDDELRSALQHALA